MLNLYDGKELLFNGTKKDVYALKHLLQKNIPAYKKSLYVISDLEKYYISSTDFNKHETVEDFKRFCRRVIYKNNIYHYKTSVFYKDDDIIFDFFSESLFSAKNWADTFMGSNPYINGVMIEHFGKLIFKRKGMLWNKK